MRPASDDLSHARNNIYRLRFSYGEFEILFYYLIFFGTFFFKFWFFEARARRRVRVVGDFFFSLLFRLRDKFVGFLSKLVTRTRALGERMYIYRDGN